MNKDNICKNSKIVDHDYEVADKVILTNKTGFKYKTLYNGIFEMTRCWTNGMVTLQCSAIKIRFNTSFIKPYTSDTNVKDIIAEN